MSLNPWRRVPAFSARRALLQNVMTRVMKKENKNYLKIICFEFEPRRPTRLNHDRYSLGTASIYLPLYGVQAIVYNSNIKPFLLQMSAPFSFIAAPSVLTRASDAVESATPDSLQRAECVVPNARQNHVKKPVIPYLRKRAHSTARIAARSQMRENPRQGAIYL